MDAAAILQKVRETYLSIEHYSDLGEVTESPEISKTPLQFKTYFSRPDKVRFEWRDWHPYFGKDRSPDESAFWTDGRSTTSWSFRKLEEEESLSMAIAGATGGSRGSVLMILKLLIPDCVDLNTVWYEFQNIKLLQEEIVGGVSCYHLVGSCTNNDDTEVWISKEDFMVRRLRDHFTLSNENRERIMTEAAPILEKMGISPESIPGKLEQGVSYTSEFSYSKVVTGVPMPDHTFNSKGEFSWDEFNS